MKNITFFRLIAILVISASCSAQHTQDVPEKSAPVTVDDAQIGKFVVSSFEDSTGNLWFGTVEYGAARYDGKALRYFSPDQGLIDKTVVSMTSDLQGRMWFGTHAGASSYDGKNFTNYGPDEGLPGMGCYILVDRKGTIWAGTNAGVFRFEGKKFREFALPLPDAGPLLYKWEVGKIWDILEDSKGNMWFARDGYGACCYDGKNFTHFTVKDGLCSNTVSNIVEDREGNIWFSCLSYDFPEFVQNGGLCRYDGHEIIRFPDQPGLLHNDVYTLFSDKSGHIWIGAVGHGVYFYDGRKFTLYNQADRPDLIRKLAVQTILEDHKGQLWFGFSGGLFRFKEGTFVNVKASGPWQ